MNQELSSPNANQLIDAVISFLTTQVAPQVDKHTQFHLKVACNVLKIVSREITSNNQDQLSELKSALAELLNSPATQDLPTLYQQLCIDIQNGAIAKEHPDLLPFLRQLTEHQLSIDNPKYSGLKR